MGVHMVVGNWKLNGLKKNSEHLVREIAHGLRETGLQTLANYPLEVVLCPPTILVPWVKRIIEDEACSICLGIQNISQFHQGAYTGEVSAEMAVDQGCRYAIVGHSERRKLFAETDEAVAIKAGRALEAGLLPIVCIGETWEERRAGKTFEVLERQLRPVIERMESRRIVLAYEPVWAIGTGETATQDQIEEVHAWLSLSKFETILYGGSVSADNAHGIFSRAHVSGGLIGGASLKADSFVDICLAARGR